ncbi:MAG: DUF21 domain-containing protein [Acidimicrobiia bacterium]|nr:DUF21 domain-containing protein [Acidimicrobiia bacterium]
MAGNAFFVAGEFALVAVERARVDRLAAEGDRRAKRVQGLVKRLSFHLSGAQLGITTSSLVLGYVSEPAVTPLIRPLLEAVGVPESSRVGVSIAIALTINTVFQMVLGELLPKNLAIARPYPMAVRIGIPMGFVNKLGGPAVAFLNSAANWTVKRLGVEPREELAGIRSVQELEMVIRGSGADGGLPQSELRMLTRAIALVDMYAEDVMVPRVSVVGVAADTSVTELRRISVETGHSRFPVYGEDLDDIVGVVHVKDTFTVVLDERESTTAAELATEPPVVPEFRPLDLLFTDLQTAKRSMAVVVDEYGGTAGIATIEDIIEEILGEIADEYDAEEEAGSGIGPHEIVDGSDHRHDVEDATGFLWPEGRYESLNGYLTAALERFPEVNDQLEVDGFQLTVLEVDGTVADRIRIERALGPELDETTTPQGDEA